MSANASTTYHALVPEVRRGHHGPCCRGGTKGRFLGRCTKTPTHVVLFVGTILASLSNFVP